MNHVDEERLTWAETRARIRADFRRVCDANEGGSFSRRLYWFFLPNYQALFLYRLYRHLYLKGWRNTARLLALFSVYATGVEISPAASIGSGCLIGHAYGVILFGRIGARCSIYGQCGTGGGFGETDIGGGPGYPVVGDDVVFGIRSVALGPIRIGDRVKLGPAAFVSVDVPDDAFLLTIPHKIIRKDAA